MDILRVAGSIILGLILVSVLKNSGSKLSNSIPIITFLIVVIYAVPSIKELIGYIGNVSSKVTSSEQITDALLRVCGINLLSHSVVTICNENGEKTLASTMEMAADIATFTVALPIFIETFELVLNTTSHG